MRPRAISPEKYQRITTWALVALVAIVVTGGAVRLTGSGLGCSDWPTCEEDSLVAPLEFHPMVEFLNRLVTGVVSVAVAAAVAGSLLRRPRRPDLVWWSLGLVAGVVAQVVLGGLLVLSELDPRFTIGHFLLSMVLVWNATVLHRRAAEPPGPRRPVVDGAALVLARLVTAVGVVVLVTGTIVTGAGPHGGDEEAERLNFEVQEVVRIHALSVIALVALTLAAYRLVRRDPSAELLRRGLLGLMAVEVVQAAIGYAQYFTDVPPLLVGLHLLGASLVWIAAVEVWLRTTTPGAADTGAVPPPTDHRGDATGDEPASAAVTPG
ncbi:MAG: COX15/CtaA family protein [Actinomycetota bacterium]|nr:COX15/CtaA family protein [Actinomycetota bacterium]